MSKPPGPRNSPDPRKSKPAPAERLSLLTDAYLHGELSPEGLVELEAMIQGDPANAERFIAVTEQAGMMREVFTNVTDQLELAEDQETGDFLSILSGLDAPGGEIPAPIDFTAEMARREREAKQRDRRNRRRAAQQHISAQASGPSVASGPLVWMGLAAVLGFAVWSGVYVLGPKPSPPSDLGLTAPIEPDPEPVDVAPAVNYVAIVQSEVGARWDNGEADGPTSLASHSPVRLAEGFARILFSDGAAVIVQGPATFEPIGTNGMRLLAGRLAASIPDTAHGFTVATPSGLITDYGTEFGVIINHDGQTLAQVFSGRIGVTPINGEEVSLRAGEALIASPRGHVRTAAADNVAFVRHDDFEAMLIPEPASYARWLAYSEQLQRDPDLMAYYVFSEDDHQAGRLQNRAVKTGQACDGLLEGTQASTPRWVDGRFPDKRGLAFAPEHGQFVRVPDHPGLHLEDEVTIALWIKRTRVRDSFGIFLTKFEAEDRVGYQFGGFPPAHPDADAQLQFVTRRVISGAVTVPVSLRASDAGWEHLVVTYNGATARFYYNGEPAGSAALAGGLAPCDADLLIGMRSPREQVVNNNNFSGVIDEVALLSRALTDAEVAQMYAAGVPDP